MNIFSIIILLCIQIYAPPANESAAASSGNSLTLTPVAVTLKDNMEAGDREGYEPKIGMLGAPLGGIWVNQLPGKIFDIHYQMGQYEIQEGEMNKTAHTNLATFSLCCVSINNSVENIHYLLMPKRQAFFSSDPKFILTDVFNQEGIQIEEYKIIENEKSLNNQLSEAKRDVNKAINKC